MCITSVSCTSIAAFQIVNSSLPSMFFFFPNWKKKLKCYRRANLSRKLSLGSKINERWRSAVNEVFGVYGNKWNSSNTYKGIVLKVILSLCVKIVVFKKGCFNWKKKDVRVSLRGSYFQNYDSLQERPTANSRRLVTCSRSSSCVFFLVMRDMSEIFLTFCEVLCGLKFQLFGH